MNAMERYASNLQEITERAFAQQKDAMEEIARRMCKAVTGGHMVYLFGTGHAHILAEEMFYRAGGLAAVSPILDEKLMLHVSASGSTQAEREPGCAARLLEKTTMGEGDVLIICSNSGRNAAPVELALLAREKGVYVVALTNLAHSRSCAPRNPEGLRLFEAADIVLDNCGAIGDASVDVGLPYRVGATSTAVGAALLEAIECRCVELALEQNLPIDVFSSSNVEGGDEINERIIERYHERIPML